jgi:hypothetical protein
MAAFRVGADDAQFLESQFAPTFAASDLMNVPNRNAFLRVLANGSPTKPFSLATMKPDTPTLSLVADIRAHSLARYGRPRAEVEAEIVARYQKPKTPPIPTVNQGAGGTL